MINIERYRDFMPIIFDPIPEAEKEQFKLEVHELAGTLCLTPEDDDYILTYAQTELPGLAAFLATEVDYRLDWYKETFNDEASNMNGEMIRRTANEIMKRNLYEDTHLVTTEMLEDYLKFEQQFFQVDLPPDNPNYFYVRLNKAGLNPEQRTAATYFFRNFSRMGFMNIALLSNAFLMPEMFAEESQELIRAVTYILARMRYNDNLGLADNIGLNGYSVNRGQLLSRMYTAIATAENSISEETLNNSCDGDQEKITDLFIYESQTISRLMIIIEDMMFSSVVGTSPDKLPDILNTESKLNYLNTIDPKEGEYPLIFFQILTDAIPWFRELLGSKIRKNTGLQIVPKSNMRVTLQDFDKLRGNLLNFNSLRYMRYSELPWILLKSTIQHLTTDQLIEYAAVRLKEVPDYYRARMVMPADEYDDLLKLITERESGKDEGKPKCSIFVYESGEGIEGGERQIELNEITSNGGSARKYIEDSIARGNFCTLYCNMRLNLPAQGELKALEGVGFELSLIPSSVLRPYFDMRIEYVEKRMGIQ